MDCREHVRGRSTFNGRSIGSNKPTDIRRSVDHRINAVDQRRIERHLIADQWNRATEHAVKPYQQYRSACDDDRVLDGGDRRSQRRVDALARDAGIGHGRREYLFCGDEPQRQSEQRRERGRR